VTPNNSKICGSFQILLSSLHAIWPVCSEILKELEEPAESEEVRLKIKAEDFRSVADATIAAFKEWVASNSERFVADEPNHEGVRVKVLGAGGEQTGWALLRASLHDPLLVINAESDVRGGALSLMRICQVGTWAARHCVRVDMEGPCLQSVLRTAPDLLCWNSHSILERLFKFACC
jgi:hypothetical protein